jgi:hypothetical protein
VRHVTQRHQSRRDVRERPRLRHLIGADADEFVDKRVDLVDGDHDRTGQRQQLRHLVDEQPRDLSRGVDPPAPAVLAVNLAAREVVVADVLVLLKGRREQGERPRGVLAGQADLLVAAPQRGDEDLEGLGGRRELPGDLGTEAPVEPDPVRERGQELIELVAAAVGEGQQLLHDRAKDLLPECLGKQVADEEEVAARTLYLLAGPAEQVGLADAALPLDDDAKRPCLAWGRLADALADQVRGLGVQALDVIPLVRPHVVKRACPVERERGKRGELFCTHPVVDSLLDTRSSIEIRCLYSPPMRSADSRSAADSAC